MRTWSSAAPTECNVCGDIIMDEFVDGKTHDGPWAIMCPDCHKVHGVGLGTGKGQRYRQVGADYVNAEDIPPPSPPRTRMGRTTSGGPG